MTALNKWYNDENGIYTRDTWVIPESGTELWCALWDSVKIIKPYGDGCHVTFGNNVYHCDELMGILERNARDGFAWGIKAEMVREIDVNGHWTKVN